MVGAVHLGFYRTVVAFNQPMGRTCHLDTLNTSDPSQVVSNKEFLAGEGKWRRGLPPLLFDLLGDEETIHVIVMSLNEV